MLLLIGILLELVAVFGLFVPYEYLLSSGTEITLKTIPVDPRSIFRGDYVTLDYEIGQNLPMDDYGKTMYFVLEQQGDTYERIGYSFDKPMLNANQVCIRGVTNYRSATFPSIRQYFVEEDTGTEFEQARNYHRLFVHAVVNSDCDAVLKNVFLGPAVPDSEVIDPFFPTETIPAPEVKS